MRERKKKDPHLKDVVELLDNDGDIWGARKKIKIDWT